MTVADSERAASNALGLYGRQAAVKGQCALKGLALFIYLCLFLERPRNPRRDRTPSPLGLLILAVHSCHESYLDFFFRRILFA